MEDFVILERAQEMPEARAQFFNCVVEGKLVRKETIITDGIDKVEVTFSKLFNGDKLGKFMVEVKSNLDIRASSEPYYRHCFFR